MKKQRKSKTRNSVRYESLEPRQLLAGISLETVAGRPTVVIDGSGADDVAVVNSLQDGQIEFRLNNTSETFSSSQFERIRFLGRNGNDTFRNNTDISSFAAGHGGNDTLTGGNGNNWLRGGGGEDVLTGGNRNDALRGDNGDDNIFGGESHDRLFGGNGDDTINGENGNDLLSGQDGADVLVGADGDDRFLGGAEADEIFGGSGDDIANGGEGNDVIGLGTGTDSATYDRAFAEYGIDGSIGNLTVFATGSTEGTDTVNAAEFLGFSDGIHDAEPYQPDPPNLNDAEEASLVLHNQLRAERNLPTLTAANDLSVFAENWSLEMSRTGFRHSPEPQRLELLVNGRTLIAENVAYTDDTSLSAQQAAELFHDGWANSPTHFANMTNADLSQIGIGMVRTDTGWWATVVFTG